MPDVSDVPSALEPLTALDRFRALDGDPGVPAGRALPALLSAAPDLKRDVVASGTPLAAVTADLATWSCPTELALGGAARSPAPTAWLVSRMVVVQWHDATGRRRTLLWEPWDHERSTPVPSAAGAGRRRVHGTVPGHLLALGIDPRDVDYLAVAHLQGHDLRRVVGPAASAPRPSRSDDHADGWLDESLLLVRRAEWEALEALHPLQRPWYDTEALGELPASRVAVLDHDVLLGPGVALIATPGRAPGNQSLVLHLGDAVWVLSSNGVAADCWAPRSSRLAGLRAWSRRRGHEVVPRPGGHADLVRQHDAMTLERCLADTLSDVPVPRCLPTAELVRHPRAPGLGAAHHHGALAWGGVRGSSPVDPVP